MDNKYLVRIIKSEVKNFKNISFGEIKYMNYSSVEKKAQIEKSDIIGIYGQNGSGKTAMVEVMDILKHVVSSREIPYKEYAGLLNDEGETSIITYFFLCIDERKYKVRYEIKLQTDDEECRINIIFEKLTYWIRGSAWRGERDLFFYNPYYDSDQILEGEHPEFESNHINHFKEVGFIKAVRNLAVYCSQNHRSVFFNKVVMKDISEDADCLGEEVENLFNVIRGLSQFARVNFHVVKVNQLGEINRNSVIPVNIHRETEDSKIQDYFPLFMSGEGEIAKGDYDICLQAIKAINIALKAVIPNLQIELEKKSVIEHKDGLKYVQAEVYSNRNGKRFLTKYESEGIKRIISLMNYLIALYNLPEVCLVVDELDSGVFEYLLGELLGVLQGGAKGQLIFTSHNLRALEKMDSQNIVCSTANPENRFIRMSGIEKNHNRRDFYIRAIVLGGQKEELYEALDLYDIEYAFRKAGANNKKNIQLRFSENFQKKLEAQVNNDKLEK